MSSKKLGLCVIFVIWLRYAESLNLLEYPLDTNKYVKDPLVVVLSGANGIDGNTDDGLSMKDEEINDREEAKYVFYSYLRTSPEENQDPLLKDHKDVLRSALRARCRKVEKCVRKCPRKKPSCPFNCQKVFDELNLCEPPEEDDDCRCDRGCRRPKCGRTLPPRWKL